MINTSAISAISSAIDNPLIISSKWQYDRYDRENSNRPEKRKAEINKRPPPTLPHCIYLQNRETADRRLSSASAEPWCIVLTLVKECLIAYAFPTEEQTDNYRMPKSLSNILYVHISAILSAKINTFRLFAHIK